MAVGSLSPCESCRNGRETPTTKLHTLQRLVKSQQQVQQPVTANVTCTSGRCRNCADTLGQAQLHRPALTCHSCVKIRENTFLFQDTEVISKQNKRKVKKANQASLLSMVNSHKSNPKKIVEVKDKWVKVRVTMDSGAAGHVMPETMFPRVKLEHKMTPKKFAATNGEQMKGIQRCITFRRVNVVKPLIIMQKVVQVGNAVVLDEKNPHIRNIRDGTVIKLDVSNGVYTMDMWICLDETGPVFSWQGQ